MSEVDCDHHLERFVSSFVISRGRERWQHLLLSRGKRTFANSHKLHDVLDRTVCNRLSGSPPVDDSTVGVFYDFYEDPQVLPFGEVYERAVNSDAIFSIVPGKLAIFFFHEGEEWLCEK